VVGWAVVSTWSSRSSSAFTISVSRREAMGREPVVRGEGEVARFSTSQHRTGAGHNGGQNRARRWL
jgi:hypothetical protein